jgi:hypothetical protein
MDKEDKKFVNWVFRTWLGWVVVTMLAIALVGGIISGITLGVRPWVLDMQRQQVQNSQQFYQTRLTAIQNSIVEFQNLDTKIAEAEGNDTLVAAYHAQQKSIVSRIWVEYDQLPESAKPKLAPDIQTFLDEHPRNWQPATPTPTV